MRKRFIVDLTHEEQVILAGLLRKGVAPARKLTRARILLLANDGGSDQAIAAALHVHPATVERTRRRLVEGNLERALTEKPRPGGRAKLDGRQEAFLIALACSQAPGVPLHAQARLVAQHGRAGVLRSRPAMPRPPPAGS